MALVVFGCSTWYVLIHISPVQSKYMFACVSILLMG